MDGISDIKIVGVDETRPPVIRKEPYIDIYFKLSHQAPIQWCNDFNALLSKHPSGATIEANKGLFISTWVRVAEEIPAVLEVLKTSIADCTQQYIERINLANQIESDKDVAAAEDTSKQGILNRVIASLNFDDDTQE